MGNAIDAARVRRLLGHRREHPITVRRHGGALVTRLVLHDGDRWTWREQPAPDAVAGLLFSDAALRVGLDSGERALADGAGVFLHPYRPATIDAEGGADVTGLWLPWSALLEVESRARTPGSILPSSPLTSGVPAFLLSLLEQHDESPPYTEHLLEGMLIEMAFAALMDAVPEAVPGSRDGRVVDLARSVMRTHCAEPGFGVAELAAELHMSARHLQRLFAAEHSAPADELRGMRVALVTELLDAPEHGGLSIAEIARCAGFRSAAALRRALAARGLPLPSTPGGGRTVAA